jgi:serine/threonine-protein kinase HipA
VPSLDLFLHERYVGTVEPVPRDRGRVTLSVDPAYTADAVLLSESFATLPGRTPPTDRVSNFLGGYVPEGNHRVRMAAKRRIADDDLFALLAEFGGSIAGAVTLQRDDESPGSHPRYEALSQKQLEGKLTQAIEESDQGLPDDSRSTLPGYQPKVLVVKDEEGWAYPRGRAHSTHILKPQVPARPTGIVDEYYSHLLAREMGLSTYSSELHTAGKTLYLAIERFDREVAGDEVRLRHQEDLAQALSLDWRGSDAKFQDPAWPTNPKRATARAIGELLGTVPGAPGLVSRWLQQLTYHVAIGNNDAHAKNVALLHLPTGTELTEIYDAVPNLFQDGLVSWDLALAVDGVFDHRRLSAERLRAEAVSWGVIPERQAESVIAETLDAFDRAIAVVSAPAGVSPGLVERLQWNVRRLRAGAEISEPKR